MNMDQRVPRMVKGQKKGKRKSNESLKVVYISSPMKVKTSATRFRSLVQQLTGKNSDIAQYMDDNNNSHDEVYEIDCEEQQGKETSDPYQMCCNYSSLSRDGTPSSSDSFPEPMNDVTASRIMKEEFEGIFSSNSFYVPSDLDVLGSFDELL